MRKLILYVDDSQPTRFLLKTIFECDHPTFDVILHETADAALSDLQARQGTREFPEVVITDLHLSFRGDDGLKLVQQIHERFPEVRLILVSGSVRSSDLERAQAAGADSIVEKDMNMQIFANRIFDLVMNFPSNGMLAIG